MKYIRFILLVLVLGLSVNANAQGIFRFYYITNSEQSDIANVCETIKSEYQSAKDNEWTAIFYLADRDNPIIVTGEDHVSRLDALISRLQENSYLVPHPADDLDKILDKMAEYDYMDSYGNVKDNYFSIDFYIYTNSSYWQSMKTDLIPGLYYALNMNDLGRKVRMTLYKSENDDIKFDKDFPLGKRTSADLNGRFKNSDNLNIIDVLNY